MIRHWRKTEILTARAPAGAAGGRGWWGFQETTTLHAALYKDADFYCGCTNGSPCKHYWIFRYIQIKKIQLNVLDYLWWCRDVKCNTFNFFQLLRLALWIFYDQKSNFKQIQCNGSACPNDNDPCTENYRKNSGSFSGIGSHILWKIGIQ